MAHRQQSVRAGQKQSSTLDCKYGVPQGSVLGPMLFTLYVTPLASQGADHAQYADDVQLYVVLNDAKATSTLRDCFAAVQHWFNVNKLSMNPDKTKAMVVGTAARRRTEGAIGSSNLAQVNFNQILRFPSRCSNVNMF